MAQMRRVFLNLSSLLVLLATAQPSPAREIAVAVRFEHQILETLIREQLFTGPEGEANVWQGRGDCGRLVLRDPTTDTAEGRLRVLANVDAHFGFSLLGLCLTPLRWQGMVEVLEQAEIDEATRAVRFRIVDSNLHGEGMGPAPVTGRVWNLIKRHVHPRLEAVHLDTGTVVEELRGLLPFLLTRLEQETVASTLDSIRLADPRVDDVGIALDLRFDVAAPPPPTPRSGPEPALTQEELEAWTQAWQRWDAFLTYVVKHFGAQAGAHELRRQLVDILLGSRFEIVSLLGRPGPEEDDPTPELFADAWVRLAPLLRRLATDAPATTALRYLSFVGAGDAVAALHAAGPEIGVELSADGLRRMARILVAAADDDPLAYSVAVDPELRQLFGLGAPLPRGAAVAAGQRRWWHTLAPVRAALADAPDLDAARRWLPTFRADRVDEYVAAVRGVLHEATAYVLAAGRLADETVDLYADLVPATAWQESCWRQFERSGETVTYVRSPVGSIGLMQVNEHAWRGIYDREGLRWEIEYNARAGSEILMHYLRDYAIARGEDSHGGLEALARATYAAYNGGPSHLARYRKAATSKSLRRIDDLFWQKYTRVRDGRENEVRRCFVGGKG